MSPTRVPPREHIKRALRQEAGFGCCVCGSWLIQYHHIIEYSTEPHDRVEDMMVLCPNHHAAATAHVLSQDAQRRYKSDPFNRRQGYAYGQLTIERPLPLIEVGSSVWGREGPVLVVDDEVLLSLRLEDHGALLISLVMRDEDDSLLAEIADNEWLYGDPLPWDIRASFRHLYVRNGHKRVTLDLDADRDPIRLRGALWKSGHLVDLGAQGIKISGPRTIDMYESMCWQPNTTYVLDTRTGSHRFGSYGEPMVRSEPTVHPPGEISPEKLERFDQFLRMTGEPTSFHALNAAVASRHPEWAPLAAVNLGILARDANERTDARMYFVTAAEYMHPEHSARAYYLLGGMSEQAGKFKAAKLFFRKCTAMNSVPWSVRARLRLGEHMLASGENGWEHIRAVAASNDEEQAGIARRIAYLHEAHQTWVEGHLPPAQ